MSEQAGQRDLPQHPLSCFSPPPRNVTKAVGMGICMLNSGATATHFSAASWRTDRTAFSDRGRAKRQR